MFGKLKKLDPDETVSFDLYQSQNRRHLVIVFQHSTVQFPPISQPPHDTAENR